MTFTKEEVLKHWGQDGLNFVNDLSETHGPERVPAPLEGETLEDYALRCGRRGLIHVAGDLHDQRDVRARFEAGDRGLPVYSIGEEEPVCAGEHLRELPIHERLAQYVREKSVLPGTVVPQSQPEEK